MVKKGQHQTLVQADNTTCLLHKTNRKFGLKRKKRKEKQMQRTSHKQKGYSTMQSDKASMQ